MFQVAYVGYVAYIAHLVAEVHKVSVEYVKGYGGSGVTEVGIAIYRRAADIHAYVAWVDWFEGFFLTG